MAKKSVRPSASRATASSAGSRPKSNASAAKATASRPSASKASGAKAASTKATGSKPSGGKRPTTLARKLTAAPAIKTQGKKPSTSTAPPAKSPAPPTIAALPPLDGKKQIRSLTKGATKVGADEAIRERLRLYPKAMTIEVVSMLGFDGIKVTPTQVERARTV